MKFRPADNIRLHKRPRLTDKEELTQNEVKTATNQQQVVQREMSVFGLYWSET
jgi:hypothetical protein